jgi:hypothetical protein
MTSPNEPHAQGDEDIPILDDVVNPDEMEGYAEYIEFADLQPQPTHIQPQVPEYDEVLLAMRDEISAQLEQDLQSIVADAVERAIDESTDRIVQILHDELDSTLVHHIRGLIAQRMEQEFGPREQHAPDTGENKQEAE